MHDGALLLGHDLFHYYSLLMIIILSSHNYYLTFLFLFVQILCIIIMRWLPQKRDLNEAKVIIIIIKNKIYKASFPSR